MWLLSVWLVIPILSTLCGVSFSQMDCVIARTCADCIGQSGDCAWCSSPDYLDPRCMDVDEIRRNCTSEFVENPQGRVVNTTTGQNSGMEQFTPLAAKLELRVGVPQSFRVEVTPTANYPLDIYILVDFSNSMFPYIENLRDVSLSLASTLHRITNDFRIGFGAFNEKPIYPFTVESSIDRKTDYSFRHVVSLTENVTAFRDGIRSMDTVANDDLPEALLEALLQAVVCTDVIGWRTDARKLVLVFTDQLYHTAGDGRWAGIFRPQDGNCHVAETRAGNRDYTMWGTLDYPSIGQVRAKLQENDIIPIFSSVDDLEEAYLNVVRAIPGARFESLGNRANRGELDSELFLTIIESSFNTTSQRVELLPVTESSSFFFVIEPTCPSDSTRSGDACDGVRIGSTASFNFSVTLMQCPFERQTVGIRIPGFGMISLRVAGVCECSCEMEKELNSSLCSSSGDHSCGVCECHEQSFGELCQCDSPEAVNLPCPEGSTANSFCSSRGQCECGMCLCDTPSPNVVPRDVGNAAYFGEGCECDNFSCPKGTDGLVCSGNGDCECDQVCSCHTSNMSQSLLRGDACQCPSEEEVCVNPSRILSGSCSNHGECQCEGCFCEEGFEGQYCENTTKVQQSCDSNRMCVECAEKIVTSETDCSSLNCSVVSIDPVEMEQYFIGGAEAIRCDFLDGNCLRTFYIIGTGFATGPIHSEKADCSGLLIPVWSIVVIIVGGLLLLGVLLLIIIKCVLVGLDRYELYRWEKDQANQEFGISDNPLYTNPEQKYYNVAYGLLSPKRDALPTAEDKQKDFILKNETEICATTL